MNELRWILLAAGVMLIAGLRPRRPLLPPLKLRLLLLTLLLLLPLLTLPLPSNWSCAG